MLKQDCSPCPQCKLWYVPGVDDQFYCQDCEVWIHFECAEHRFDCIWDSDLTPAQNVVTRLPVVRGSFDGPHTEWTLVGTANRLRKLRLQGGNTTDTEATAVLGGDFIAELTRLTIPVVACRLCKINNVDVDMM